MTRLTPLMWDALKAAHKHNGQLRRIHHPDTPGVSPWPAPAGTLRALERHGLMVLTRVLNKDGLPTDVWEITQAGKDALDPPMRTIKDTAKWSGIKAHATTRKMRWGAWVSEKAPEAEPLHDHEELLLKWEQEARALHDAADWRNASGRDTGKAKAA